MVIDKLQVFTGNANPALAGKICDCLGVSLGQAEVGRFPDGEVRVKVHEDVRGSDVFVVQPTCPPVNDNLMELLLLVDCLKRASVKRVTAVIPQYGYGRQDRKDEGRVPISAKLIANLIVTAGADRVLALDLHSNQIQGFFDIPVDHLYGSQIFMPYLQQLQITDLVIAAPDVGKSKVARAYANRLRAGLAIVEKTRINPEEVKAGYVIGKVKDKNIVIIDDIIETGGSVAEATGVLKEAGAKKIYVVATHGVFCGPATERLSAAPIERIVVTDSGPVPQSALDMGVEVLSVAPLLAETIKRIHLQQSVSALFEFTEDT